MQALKIIEADATPLLATGLHSRTFVPRKTGSVSLPELLGEVESDAVSEVLARLAAISSREKAHKMPPPGSLRRVSASQALELVHRSPSLLAAAMGGKAGPLLASFF